MISIIVPVYNAVNKLSVLVDSIFLQTYKDYEVLLVDDGSSDGSGKLCDDYSEKYPHFRAFHKINGGQSSARNLGIKEAKGEYIYFADDDDELLPNCLETLVKGITSQNDIDWAIGKALFRKNNEIINKQQSIQTHIFSVEEITSEYLKPKYFPIYAPWMHLFKTSIIRDNKLCFNDKFKGAEDRVFTFNYLCCIKGKIYHSTQPIYIWNIGIGTLNSISKKHNHWYATIFYGQCEVYEKTVKHDFSTKYQKWAKHTMINSYLDKKRFYEKYKDANTVDQINKRFYQLATKRDLVIFKLREYLKVLLAPFLLILRKIRRG